MKVTLRYSNAVHINFSALRDALASVVYEVHQHNVVYRARTKIKRYDSVHHAYGSQLHSVLARIGGDSITSRVAYTFIVTAIHELERAHHAGEFDLTDLVAVTRYFDTVVDHMKAHLCSGIGQTFGHGSLRASFPGIRHPDMSAWSEFYYANDHTLSSFQQFVDATRSHDSYTMWADRSVRTSDYRMGVLRLVYNTLSAQRYDRMLYTTRGIAPSNGYGLPPRINVGVNGLALNGYVATHPISRLILSARPVVDRETTEREDDGVTYYVPNQLTWADPRYTRLTQFVGDDEKINVFNSEGKIRKTARRTGSLRKFIDTVHREIIKYAKAGAILRPADLEVLRIYASLLDDHDRDGYPSDSHHVAIENEIWYREPEIKISMVQGTDDIVGIYSAARSCMISNPQNALSWYGNNPHAVRGLLYTNVALSEPRRCGRSLVWRLHWKGKVYGFIDRLYNDGSIRYEQQKAAVESWIEEHGGIPWDDEVLEPLPFLYENTYYSFISRNDMPRALLDEPPTEEGDKFPWAEITNPMSVNLPYLDNVNNFYDATKDDDNNVTFRVAVAIDYDTSFRTADNGYTHFSSFSRTGDYTAPIQNMPFEALTVMVYSQLLERDVPVQYSVPIYDVLPDIGAESDPNVIRTAPAGFGPQWGSSHLPSSHSYWPVDVFDSRSDRPDDTVLLDVDNVYIRRSDSVVSVERKFYRDNIWRPMPRYLHRLNSQLLQYVSAAPSYVHPDYEIKYRVSEGDTTVMFSPDAVADNIILSGDLLRVKQAILDETVKLSDVRSKVEELLEKEPLYSINGQYDVYAETNGLNINFNRNSETIREVPSITGELSLPQSATISLGRYSVHGYMCNVRVNILTMYDDLAYMIDTGRPPAAWRKTYGQEQLRDYFYHSEYGEELTDRQHEPGTLGDMYCRAVEALLIANGFLDDVRSETATEPEATVEEETPVEEGVEFIEVVRHNLTGNDSDTASWYHYRTTTSSTTSSTTNYGDVL